MQTRLLAIFAALFAAAALIAGCSSNSQDSSKALPDAATLLKQSSDTTKAQTSVHLKLSVQGQIQDLPIETLEGDLTNKPAVGGGGGGARRVMGGARPAADIYDVSALLNPDAGLGNILANFSDPKADGRENINGGDAVRITGTVSADAVNKIAPQLKVTGPVPGTAWIREDGNHELVQVKLETSPNTSITMTCSDWGKPVAVTKPAV
jgi:lipoprotein LprG